MTARRIYGSEAFNRSPHVLVRKVKSRRAIRAELVGWLKAVGNAPGDGGRVFLRHAPQLVANLIPAGALVILAIVGMAVVS